MSVSFERMATGVLLSCAILVTAVVLRRELRDGEPQARGAFVEVDTLSGWMAYASLGQPMGNVDATEKLLIFSDFQCPSCRGFAMGLLPSILERYGNKLDIRFIHWPLPYHPEAYPAALGAYCAGDQGRFQAYHDYVFENQQVLGVVDYSQIATRAGVPDTVAFSECMRSEWADSLVTESRTAAEGAGNRGTPTVVFRGVRWTGVPDSLGLFKELERSIRQDHASDPG